MFIPFLENSFLKHGLSNQISTGFANIRLLVEEHDITFYREQQNPDTLSRTVAGTGNIRLINIHRRLNLLYESMQTGN